MWVCVCMCVRMCVYMWVWVGVTTNAKTEEALEELKMKYRETKTRMDAETDSLQAQIDILQSAIKVLARKRTNEARHARMNRWIDRSIRTCIHVSRTTLAGGALA